MTNKVPLILFSGGVDSATLLTLTLHETDCDIITVCTNILYDKQIDLERIAREKILTELCYLRNKIKELHSVRNKFIIDMTFSDESEVNSNMTFGQVPIWFYTALNVVDPRIHSSVHIGYISGDQICNKLHLIKEAWNNIWKACKIGDIVPLEFRLADLYMSKDDVVNYLATPVFDEILSSTHYCEQPIFINNHNYVCNNCTSCKRMRQYKTHQMRVLDLMSSDYSI